MLQKLRFFGSVSLLYVVTIGVVGYLSLPSPLFGAPVYADTKQIKKPNEPVKPRFVLVSGKPIRIVIPDYGIDLPIDDGYYDTPSGSWTLSDTHAQFAVISKPANNTAGTTFIYGHGTDTVFGKLNTTAPAAGTSAQIFTDNHQLFIYQFQESKRLTPNDTTIFDTIAIGPPQLTIQTCTGIFSEWRTMFTFTFVKVTRQ